MKFMKRYPGALTRASALAVRFPSVRCTSPSGRKGLAVFNRFIRNESGATAIEYGLIATLIVVAVIGGITAVGNATILQMNNIASHL